MEVLRFMSHVLQIVTVRLGEFDEMQEPSTIDASTINITQVRLKVASMTDRSRKKLKENNRYL